MRPAHGRHPPGLAHLRRPDIVVQVRQPQHPAEGRRHVGHAAVGHRAQRSPKGAKRHDYSATVPESASAPRRMRTWPYDRVPGGARPLPAGPVPRRRRRAPVTLPASCWARAPRGQEGHLPPQRSPAGQVCGLQKPWPCFAWSWTQPKNPNGALLSVGAQFVLNSKERIVTRVGGASSPSRGSVQDLGSSAHRLRHSLLLFWRPA